VHHLQDGDAVDLLLGLDLELVADLRPLGEDRAVEHTLGLPSTGGAPGPGAITERTGEFDVDPSRHEAQRYRLDLQRHHCHLSWCCDDPPAPGSDGPRVYRRVVPIYALGDLEPVIDAAAYVHPDAVVIGAVTIGPHSSIWPGAVLRGDDGEIIVGASSSIQDNCVLHTTPEWPTLVGDRCVIGHLVHLEGCTIEDDVLVGNASMVLHRSVVRSWAIVAANSVVLYDVEVPSDAVAAGSPAVVKPGKVRREMITAGSESYVARAERFRADLRRLA
jgi:carbonic anhydrase/acetyltransferase-like protein (isoleucine patch superfamily)